MSKRIVEMRPCRVTEIEIGDRLHHDGLTLEVVEIRRTARQITLLFHRVRDGIAVPPVEALRPMPLHREMLRTSRPLPIPSFFERSFTWPNCRP